MNRTNTKIKAIGTRALYLLQVNNTYVGIGRTCQQIIGTQDYRSHRYVRNHSTTHIYKFSSPSLMSDKEARFPLKEFLLTASYRARLKQNSPKSEKGDESDS